MRSCVNRLAEDGDTTIASVMAGAQPSATHKIRFRDAQGKKHQAELLIRHATRTVLMTSETTDFLTATEAAQVFMKRVEEKIPFTTQTVLNDNGKSFTGRFARVGERRLSGQRLFDQECQAHGIEHHLIKPSRPQKNGMVEGFGGRISDVLAPRRYISGEDLEQPLKCYAWLYNHQIPQKVLHHQAPLAAMREWQSKRPELFTKRVVNHTGPDTYAC